MVMTESTPARRRTRNREEESITSPVYSIDDTDEDKLRLLIRNNKFHELFDFMGHPKTQFNNLITRSRNPDVEHERAWEESKGAIEYVFPDALDPLKYNPNIVKNLFIVEREKFVRILKDPKGFRTEDILANYRIGRSRAFRQIEDDFEFKRYEILSQVLFNEGFFQK